MLNRFVNSRAAAVLGPVLYILLAACGLIQPAELKPAQPTPAAKLAPAAFENPQLASSVLPGRLVLSAERDGRWDLYAADPNGEAWQRLTDDGGSRAPAPSPDGGRIAYESHRDGNWEIYVASPNGSSVNRLTRDDAFDGQPSWSPDGRGLAFASTRQGDLDVWTMNADGTDATDLTKDSPAVDDTPSWSPDGRWIAFTSWRTGTAQIFIVSPDDRQTLNLSQNKFDDQSPAWSPEGRRVAFVSDRDGQRAIYVADFSTDGLKNARRLTFSGWDDAPVWSPDGRFIAFVSPRPTRQLAYIVPAAGGVPRAVDDGVTEVRSVAWGNANVPLVDNNSAFPASAPLFATPSPQVTPALIAMKDVYLAPSYGEMSNQVASSFEALRARVKQEAGWDFLGALSDMTRQLGGGVCGDGCEIMSWHKTGRAVDTRLSVGNGPVSMMELVREDLLGETYWRVYLRAAKQDGTEGEPLTQAPWDWTYYARWTLAPHQGGVPKAILPGYYVDFTELAREYGWDRISSLDSPDLSWKETNVGMEFWHFQRTEGLVWYPALRELYSAQTLESVFDWNNLLKQKQDEYLLPLKGIPAPPGAWRWYVLPP